MELDSQSEVILLLTVSLEGYTAKSVKPLSLVEWAQFAFWLKENNHTPASLIDSNLEDLLSSWESPTINLQRLKQLLGRSVALGLSLEKWSRAGLWVITKSDSEYPRKLKERLGKFSPPVIFGCGNKSLLNGGGIAVIGSSEMSNEKVDYTISLGKKIANDGFSVISSEAGCSSFSVTTGALGNSGTAITLFPNNLLKATVSAKYRKYIMSGDIVLISPFYPEAAFNVENTAIISRYVYALSNAAILICTTPNTGDVWHGAVENLEKAWVPLWMKNNGVESGNALLQKYGATWLPSEIVDVNFLEHFTLKTEKDIQTPQELPLKCNDINEEKSNIEMNLYDCFIMLFAKITEDNSLSIEDIANKLSISKSQAGIWVKFGVSEGKILKEKRPIRYKFQPRLI